MNHHNPYQSPTADLDSYDTQESYHTEPFYTWHGRIGRVRYLSYTMLLLLMLMGIMTVFGVLIGILVGVTGGADSAAMTVAVILWVASLLGNFYVTFVPSIRRLNDPNRTGWMSLLWFVPVVNLVFWLYLTFATGDDGENDYGVPAEPPTTLHYVLAFGLPILAIALLGILAAIALPAYQDYVMRAQMAQLGTMP